MKEDLLIIENISKTFKVDKNKELQALKNINIRLNRNCWRIWLWKIYFG